MVRIYEANRERLAWGKALCGVARRTRLALVDRGGRVSFVLPNHSEHGNTEWLEALLETARTAGLAFHVALDVARCRDRLSVAQERFRSMGASGSSPSRPSDSREATRHHFFRCRMRAIGSRRACRQPISTSADRESSASTGRSPSPLSARLALSDDPRNAWVPAERWRCGTVPSGSTRDVLGFRQGQNH